MAKKTIQFITAAAILLLLSLELSSCTAQKCDCPKFGGKSVRH